jgi:pyocin large subunit-like protein
MTKVRALRLLLLSILVLGFGESCSLHRSPPASNASAAGSNRNAATRPVRTEAPSVGFASPSKLAEHYEKHGREFGSVTIDQYLRMAQELRDRPVEGTVVEALRSDGVVTRFDRASGAFLAFNRDRTIRTFFKPNDGESYFRRQLNRRD